MNIGSVLTRAARRWSEAPATIYGADTRSYAAVNARANRLASALRRRGIARGDRVAILQRNGSELIETMFGAFKAGCAAVPINARLHPKEYQYIIDHSDAKVVVYTREFVDGMGAIRAALPKVGHFVCVDGAPDGAAAYEDLLADGDPADADAEVGPDDLAWFFYTSGTTGRPKGAMVTHRNLAYMTEHYFGEVWDLEPGTVVLHAGPLTHGSGLWAIPLTAGGAVQLINDSPSFDPAHLFGLVERHAVRKIVFVAPTMITMLLRSEAIGRYDLSSLEFIGYGGSNMHVEDLKRAIRQFGPVLCQIYGQGESPMTISMLAPGDHVLGDDPRLEQRLASAGRPRVGVEIAILDERDRPLAVGEIGEVGLRSEAIMKGYWKDETATAEAFKAGWYHTGDLGRFDEDGYLYLLDRKKELIISGGANIYPREVEEVLLLHPDVVEVAVVGVADRLWGESALAVIRTGDGAPIPEEEIAELCRSHMAGYKKPRHLRFVDALPKNAYGKVLKRELRERFAPELAEGMA